jgi:hypothetical protein
MPEVCAMTGILRIPRSIALAAIAVLIGAASLVSFAESYRGLYTWAHHHGLGSWWAAIWPLQVDVFIAVGELALFVALVDRWRPRQRAAAWAVTGIGLAVSVAGNVGHVAGHALTSRVTAAVPPLAAAAALAVGLGVLKRIMEQRPEAAAQSAPGVPRDNLDAAIQAMIVTHLAGNGHSARGLATRFELPPKLAGKVRQLVLAESNGHAPQAPEGDHDE